MIEVITRRSDKSDQKLAPNILAYHAIKSQLSGEKSQVAINDWGHLTIRIIDGQDDTLVVLNRETTNRVINFLRKNSDFIPF